MGGRGRGVLGRGVLGGGVLGEMGLRGGRGEEGPEWNQQNLNSGFGWHLIGPRCNLWNIGNAKGSERIFLV